MSQSPPSSSPGDGRQAPRWGYERPDCRGPRALGLFIDDLDRVLEEHTAGRESSPLGLMAAQHNIDLVMQHYVRIGAHPTAFNGQTVTLKQGTDAQGQHHVVPIFSAGLKQALIAMLPKPGGGQ